MLTNVIEDLNTFVQTSQLYLVPWLYCFAGLWAFNIVNWVLGSPLNIFGIYPRHIFGLLGIIFSPILHKNFSQEFLKELLFLIKKVDFAPEELIIEVKLLYSKF